MGYHFLLSGGTWVGAGQIAHRAVAAAAALMQ